MGVFPAQVSQVTGLGSCPEPILQVQLPGELSNTAAESLGIQAGSGPSPACTLGRERRKDREWMPAPQGLSSSKCLTRPVCFVEKVDSRN